MPVAFDPPKARLDVQERRGHPALLLVAVLPPVDLVGALADQRSLATTCPWVRRARGRTAIKAVPTCSCSPVGTGPTPPEVRLRRTTPCPWVRRAGRCPKGRTPIRLRRAIDYRGVRKMEAAVGVEPTYEGFADPCLTTWRRRLLEPG